MSDESTVSMTATISYDDADNPLAQKAAVNKIHDAYNQFYEDEITEDEILEEVNGQKESDVGEEAVRKFKKTVFDEARNQYVEGELDGEQIEAVMENLFITGDEFLRYEEETSHISDKRKKQIVTWGVTLGLLGAGYATVTFTSLTVIPTFFTGFFIYVWLENRKI